MSPRARIALIGAAVAAAVVAFVVLQPGDDDDQEPAGERTVATAPAQTAPRTEEQAETATTGTAPRRPEVPRVIVRQDEPVGGVIELTFERGERVRFEVDVDAPYEVHLHGYDVIERATPDRPARFSFEADAEGIFEVELEGPHTQIAELRVEP